MNIDRRHLALPALALGFLAAMPKAQALTADEQTVAKNLEAFRAAQAAQDAKTLDSLTWPELSYSHSDAHIEDKATFIKNATNGKSKVDLARIQGPDHSCRRHRRDRAVPLGGGERIRRRSHAQQHEPRDSDRTWQKRGGQWKLLDRGSTKL